MTPTGAPHVRGLSRAKLVIFHAVSGFGARKEAHSAPGQRPVEGAPKVGRVRWGLDSQSD